MRRSIHGEIKPGYAVIQTTRGSKTDFSRLDASIKLVHIDGPPGFWAFKKILKRAPNLKTIQLPPRALRRVGTASFNLCRERKIKIVTGFHAPHLAWKRGEQRTPAIYEQRKAFLMSLQGHQKELFDELLAHDILEAKMVSRYFCLQGERYKPINVLMKENGFSNRVDSLFGTFIHTIMLYLDPDYPVYYGAVTKVATIKRKVEAARLANQAEKESRDAAMRLGLDRLPRNLPVERRDLFGKLLFYRDAGLLNRLEQDRPNAHRVLTLRFGLDRQVVTEYRTLKQVGQELGITRQRVCQLENRALRHIGLKE